MQGTIASKLPPNLLKLFSPRPPPPFFKPLGKDPDEPGPNKLQGVASVVQRLKEDEEERVFKRDTAGQGTEGEAVENKVTLAPLYQKQVRKEEAKKQKDEYKKNLEKSCEYHVGGEPDLRADRTLLQTTQMKMRTQSGTRIKPYSSLDWYVMIGLIADRLLILALHSPRRRQKRTCDESSKCMGKLNAYG
jgi:U1 small nuclear ribonucleoprotein